MHKLEGKKTLVLAEAAANFHACNTTKLKTLINDADLTKRNTKPEVVWYDVDAACLQLCLPHWAAFSSDTSPNTFFFLFPAM